MIWYRTALLTLTFAVALSVGARASTLTLSFNTVWTGATPAGTPDVAILTMQDVSNGVLITLTHSPNSAAGQFISKLNLRFYRQPTGADFTGDPFVVSIGRFGGYVDAGRNFNAEVRFKVAPPAARLLPGRTSSFRIFGVSVADFVPGNTSAMIHVQGIPPSDASGKLIVPEPGSVLALCAGIAGLSRLRPRQR